MGTYLSIPLYLRNTVTLEPIVKKADTGAVKEGVSSASSELQNVTKVTDTTSPITTNQVELYIKGEKKVVLEPAEPLKMVDAIEEKNDDNVLLLSSDELKQRILGMAEDATKQQKEKVSILHKKVCAELLHKAHHSKNDSDDEDIVPLSREELRDYVLRELENRSKKAIIKTTTPVLESIKEESVHHVHPFLLEYGVNPIKSNTLFIQNHTYQKTESSLAQAVQAVQAVAAVQAVPVAPAVPVPNQSNKKNKRKKH